MSHISGQIFSNEKTLSNDTLRLDSILLIDEAHSADKNLKRVRAIGFPLLSCSHFVDFMA